MFKSKGHCECFSKLVAVSLFPIPIPQHFMSFDSHFWFYDFSSADKNANKNALFESEWQGMTHNSFE